MRTYTKGNTQNVKQARKQSKELRKLKSSRNTISVIETDEAFKGLQHSYHYEDDYNAYEGGLLMKILENCKNLVKLYIKLFKQSWRL